MCNVHICQVQREQSCANVAGVGPVAPTYEELTRSLLHDWDFAPYPQPTLRQLHQVDVYLVALQAHGEGVGTSSIQSDEAKPLDSASIAAANTTSPVLGVVGIVWVPLGGMSSHSASSSSSRYTAGAHASCNGAMRRDVCREVEGYLQVVLVAPEHRRRGIAKRLLAALMHLNLSKASATDKTNTTPADVSLPLIQRWRLHTMRASSDNTQRYLADLFKKQQDSLPKEQQEKGEKQQKPTHVSGPPTHSCCCANRVGELTDNVRAVERMYECIGFRLRRVMHRYYDGAADGIEMVRHMTTRKTQRDEG